MTKISGTLHEDEYTFSIISLSVHRMKNVSDESCRENQNTYSPPPKILPFMT